jgi:hypothetical protein
MVEGEEICALSDGIGESANPQGLLLTSEANAQEQFILGSDSAGWNFLSVLRCCNDAEPQRCHKGYVHDLPA